MQADRNPRLWEALLALLQAAPSGASYRRTAFESWAIVALLFLLAASCSDVGAPVRSSPVTPILDLFDEDTPMLPALDEELIAEGVELYQQYCASCHKADLSGESNWMTPKPDGTYPAPPHDSSGHTWHHPDPLLVEIVTVGLEVPGSSMPTFGDQLSDSQVMSIIEYLKSNWGEEERTFQWHVTWQEQQRTDS